MNNMVATGSGKELRVMDRNNYTDRIDQVMKYIEQNITQQLNLEELAKRSNVSKYHF